MMHGTSDSPMPTGVWMNPKTGHKIDIRESFIMDGQIMLQLKNGKMIPLSEVQDSYFQSHDAGDVIESKPRVNIPELERPTKKLPDNVQVEDTPRKVNIPGVTDLLPDDLENIYSNERRVSLDNPTSPFSNTTPLALESTVDVVTKQIIEKMFDKKSIKAPKLDVSISWKSYPKEDVLKMMEMFNISEDQISEVLFNKFLRGYDFREDAKKSLENLIYVDKKPTNPKKTKK